MKVFFVVNCHDNCAFQHGLQRPVGNLILPLWCSVSFSTKMRGLGNVISESLRVYECFLKHRGPLIMHLLYAIATRGNLQTFSYLILMTIL